jgi:hypothetical protein
LLAQPCHILHIHQRRRQSTITRRRSQEGPTPNRSAVLHPGLCSKMARANQHWDAQMFTVLSPAQKGKNVCLLGSNGLPLLPCRQLPTVLTNLFTNTNKTTAVSMKRKGKAETTVTKTVTTTKRTKKVQEADTNDNNDDAKDHTIETPRKKRAAAKNVKYGEDSDEAKVETTTVVKQTVKQTVKQKRTKKKRTKEQNAAFYCYECSPTSRRPKDNAAEDIKERP